MHHKTHMLAAAVLAVLTTGTSRSAPTHVLAESGKTGYTIAVSSDATTPERHAAAELASFLSQVSGVSFAVATRDSRPDTPTLVVGPGAAAKALVPDLDPEALKPDGILIKSVGQHIVLAGARPRGTLYAVYTFLQDAVGCRWWSSKVSTIPVKKRLTVEEQNVRYVPPLEYRETFWFDSFDPDWAVRNKSNANRAALDEKRGGHITYKGFVHTFDGLVPPDKYFDKHPEWYSLIEGERRDAPRIHASLCLTNEEMQQQFLENFSKEIRGGPALFRAGGKQYVGYIDKTDNPLMFASVSPEDDSGYPVRCQCERCVAVEKAEGSPAGLALRFANQMARGIREEFPDKTVCMYAYHYTQKPPRLTRPEPGMVIYFCPIHAASQSRPLTAPRFKRWNDDLHGWLQICDLVYLYDYPDNVSYPFVPHPNLRALAANIRNWAEIGVTGYFGDGIGGGTGGTEMAELRVWLIARLLWDPTQDPDALINEFCDGYYGGAGPHIVAYLDGMHDALEISGDWLDLSSPPTAHFLSIDTLAGGWAHLAAAEEAVREDPVLSSRVRVAQLPVRFVCLARWNHLKDDASCRGIPWPFGDSREKAHADFMEVVRANNVAFEGASRQLLEDDRYTQRHK